MRSVSPNLINRYASQFVRKPVLFVTGLAFAFAAGQARADVVTGYNNDPTADSTDFSTGVFGLGGAVITLDVGTLSTGPLDTTAFSGVTLAGTDSFTIVSAGAGPADGNDFTTPLSSGEGLSTSANYIGDDSTRYGSLTVSFDTPVLGAGIFLIDLFNPGAADPVTLEAFTGTDGTGTALGTFDAAQYNFQNNNLYFMGITSSGGDIGSIVLIQPFGNPGGDRIGLGNILFSTPSGSPSAVPEPNAILFLLPVVVLIGVLARRKTRTV